MTLLEKAPVFANVREMTDKLALEQTVLKRLGHVNWAIKRYNGTVLCWIGIVAETAQSVSEYVWRHH